MERIVENTTLDHRPSLSLCCRNFRATWPHHSRFILCVIFYLGIIALVWITVITSNSIPWIFIASALTCVILFSIIRLTFHRVQSCLVPENVIEEINIRHTTSVQANRPLSRDVLNKLEVFDYQSDSNNQLNSDFQFNQRMDYTCSVCLSDYTQSSKLIRLPCSHAYHQECIVAWLKGHSTCPICKQGVAASMSRFSRNPNVDTPGPNQV